MQFSFIGELNEKSETADSSLYVRAACECMSAPQPKIVKLKICLVKVVLPIFNQSDITPKEGNDIWAVPALVAGVDSHWLAFWYI